MDFKGALSDLPQRGIWPRGNTNTQQQKARPCWCQHCPVAEPRAGIGPPISPPPCAGVLQLPSLPAPGCCTALTTIELQNPPLLELTGRAAGGGWKKSKHLPVPSLLRSLVPEPGCWEPSQPRWSPQPGLEPLGGGARSLSARRRPQNPAPPGCSGECARGRGSPKGGESPEQRAQSRSLGRSLGRGGRLQALLHLAARRSSVAQTPSCPDWGAWASPMHLTQPVPGSTVLSSAAGLQSPEPQGLCKEKLFHCTRMVLWGAEGLWG